jgi:collagenase-like PrtC family protease
LPYELIHNGKLRELRDFSYLLLPQDLCGIDQLPRLMEAHVSCLKIEGHLKQDAAYVTAMTQAYCNTIDQVWDNYWKRHPKIPKTPAQQLKPESVTRAKFAHLFS